MLLEHTTTGREAEGGVPSTSLGGFVSASSEKGEGEGEWE